MFSGIDQRELGRKERAVAEYYRQLKRYDYECGDVITYKLSPRTDEASANRGENGR